MTHLSSRSLLLPALTSLLLGTLPAQNTAGFSFDGTWLASGRTDEGSPPGTPGYLPSHLTLTIDGFPDVVVAIPRGSDAGDVTILCIYALAHAGFHITMDGPTRFHVTGHTSGQAIRGGCSVLEDDDDMSGCDLTTSLAPNPWPGQQDAPTERGYALARPAGTMPSQGGVIRTTLEFEGAATPTVIVVNVPTGSYAQQIDMLMFQGFVQNGIVPRAWQVAIPGQPGTTRPMFGLLRDTLGRRVSHVQFEPLIETELVAMHLQSCMPITVGVTEYGWSWPATSGMHLDSASNPRVGMALTIDLKTGLPSSFAGLIVGMGDWSVPVPQLLAGTPAPSHNGPTVFVQPVGGPITGFTDGAGQLHHTLLIPADPSFVGLPLRWQGFDINAPGPTTVWLSNGLITNVGA